MAQVFAKAEGIHQGLHGPASHAGSDFTREQAGRGARKEQVDLFAVQQAAGKAFPPRNTLDFVKKEGCAPPVAPFRVQTVVLLHHQIEVAGSHAGETFIFEAEIQQPFPVSSPENTIRQHLPEKRRLACAPHADNGDRLAGNGRQPHIPMRQRRWTGGQGVDNLLPDDLAEVAFHEGHFS